MNPDITNLSTEQFDNMLQTITRSPIYRPLVKINIYEFILGRGSLVHPEGIYLEEHYFATQDVPLKDLETIELIPYPELADKLFTSPATLSSMISDNLYTKYKVTKKGGGVQEAILSHNELINLFKNAGNYIYLKSHYLSNVLYNFFSLGV